MKFFPAELSKELQMLRRGRGVHTPGIGNEVGPALRDLCGITDSDTHAIIREKVISKLCSLSEKLPEDLQTIIRTTLALNVEAQGKFLNDRVKLLAIEFDRDVRTIRRRMNEAIDLLVENALKQEEFTSRATEGKDWHVRRFEAILRMDGTAPECIERRTIVAERDGLNQIRISITLPQDSNSAGSPIDLHAEPFFGARLVDKQLLPGGRFSFELRLPVMLSAGQTHDFGLLVRIPNDQVMHPHYVFFPERPCDVFDLRVRFAPSNVPAEVVLVSGVFHRAIDDPASSGRVLTVDEVNEVHVAFSSLLPGYGYGVRWTGGS
jgi:hypothetical protein